MPKWYKIRAKGRAAEVLIYGDIGESWADETVTAKNFVEDLNAIEAEAITFRINSVGGSVPDGLAIYNAIRRHPAETIAAVDGMAMSVASLIAMAADRVTMAQNAILMIHAPWSYAVGNAADLRDHADTLDTWAAAMASGYVQQTGKSLEDILALLTDGKDHYFTADEALALGFIDEISDPIAIAAAARVPAHAIARYTPDSVVDKISIDGDDLDDYLAEHFGQILQKVKSKEGQTMTSKTTPKQATEPKPAATAAEPAGVDIETVRAEARAEALAQDKERRTAIEAEFRPFLKYTGMADLQARLVNDQTVTAEAAGKQILARLGEGVEPVAGHITVRPNEQAEKFRDGVVASVLARAGMADQATREQAKASGFMNMTLLELAKASLSRASIDFSAMSTQQIALAALTQSTSDFPVLLENAMHKALLQGYRAIPDTWSRFCARGSVSDFRAHGRHRTGSIGNYQTTNENGEYVNVAIPDGEKQTLTAVDRGIIINLTYQMIVNDDLGAFIGLAADLGRSGARTIESAVYALLAENSGLGPTMADTNPLFYARTGANNIGTGAAISMASIEADRVVMASQTDVGGNDFLDARPAVWVGPMGSGGTARSINEAQYDPDTANKLQKPNMVRGLFRDIVDSPRISGTRYYMFADPAEIPVIEVAFVNGESEPYIMQEEAFTSRGVKYRATLDFGVAAVGFRGCVTNAGA